MARSEKKNGTRRSPGVKHSLTIYISKLRQERNSVMSSYLPLRSRKTLFVELIESGMRSTGELFGGCAAFQGMWRDKPACHRGFCTAGLK